jgi:hypothetical protein
MGVRSPRINTTLSLAEMEDMIRRAVKEAVHEEFARVLRRAPASVADDWTHEGPSDPAGDQLLLAEALTERERYRTDPETWMDWDAFKAELEAAEAAGELPD